MENKTELFLVIDGSSMLVTDYYGTLPKQILFEKDEEKKERLYPKLLHTPDGTYTNAVYGMTKRMLKILKEQKPEYLAVVFDKTRNTFRRKQYADYKANRAATPSPLKQQFVTMEKLLEEMGIMVLYDDTFEADDLAGSIVSKFEGPGIAMRFMTKDADYTQLVSDYTRGWMVQSSQDRADAMFGEYMDPELAALAKAALPARVFEFAPLHVLEEMGVRPEQVPDLKGIAGDSSDNIPGIRGVAEKTAIPLLKEYGTIEGIRDILDSIPAGSAEEKELTRFWKESLGIKRPPVKALREGMAMGLLSKSLTTIRRDAPIPEDLESYRVSVRKDRMHDAFERLGFRSLI